ncbi:LysE/ArgO family amino acid transporter [Kineococcus glutinatus]|uniref:LysE family transporter n=1 Tax=Kineococcus glutinatus TaxID=1070872 RepID=A0ABP9I802_9ACTN
MLPAATTDAPLAALAGLGLGLSLIAAIGAQNAFVLRQGLRGEHLPAVVALCAASDAVLIAAGVGGGGVLLGRWPWLLPVVRGAGGVFLLGYALLALRRALRPGSLVPQDPGGRTPRGRALTTCLLLTWLNPHVYLDTVVLLGSVAQAHGGLRWWFAAGAAAASAAWFSGLGFGAVLLRPVFARPAAWRVLDLLVAAVMTTLGASLLIPLLPQVTAALR